MQSARHLTPSTPSPRSSKSPISRGKTVSIGGTKDVTLIYMEAFLASAGLKASDLDFVYAKATQDRLAALLSGGADAAILYPPSTFRAGSAGYTYLGDIETYLKDFPFTVWAANVDLDNLGLGLNLSNRNR